MGEAADVALLIELGADQRVLQVTKQHPGGTVVDHEHGRSAFQLGKLVTVPVEAVLVGGEETLEVLLHEGRPLHLVDHHRQLGIADLARIADHGELALLERFHKGLVKRLL
ncbi:hypothetical protein ADS77_21370 [Pseudoalteromonas porphyrae]|uniref:Uncharacterized protein n=1 Tax=Pseudoalteromonas porphyrae TaxID=187330 RepID=A0A0N1MR35_9GAMM|nr:hypothetical protein ADS77_21370 [Pseudoalteromonas porphyrae]